ADSGQRRGRQTPPAPPGLAPCATDLRRPAPSRLGPPPPGGPGGEDPRPAGRDAADPEACADREPPGPSPLPRAHPPPRPPRPPSGAGRTPLGSGVAVGGMVDPDRRSIVTINLAPVLDGCPLGDELAQRFGMPVLLDHHPRALLVGDRWFGKGRGARTFAVVY